MVPARPEQQAPDQSGPRRTSTANRSGPRQTRTANAMQWSPLGPSRKRQIAVVPAGPEQQPLDQSDPCISEKISNRIPEDRPR